MSLSVATWISTRPPLEPSRRLPRPASGVPGARRAESGASGREAGIDPEPADQEAEAVQGPGEQRMRGETKRALTHRHERERDRQGREPRDQRQRRDADQRERERGEAQRLERERREIERLASQ